MNGDIRQTNCIRTIFFTIMMEIDLEMMNFENNISLHFIKIDMITPSFKGWHVTIHILLYNILSYTERGKKLTWLTNSITYFILWL